MATQHGTILTIWGHTTPFYDVFSLDTVSSTQSWNYDDGIIIAGSFKPGIAYTIASVGTTDFTLIGAASNTVGLTFVATGIPPYGNYDNGVGTGTGTATVAGQTRMAQPLPAAGQIAGGLSWKYAPSTPNLTDGAPIGGQPQTPGSPYPTQSFVVEVLYLTGTGPDYTQSVDYYRTLALTAANAAFGLAMV
jgi:large repetitive protein